MKQRKLLLAALLAVSLTIPSYGAFREGTAAGQTAKSTEAWANPYFNVNTLNVPAGTETLIVVASNGESANATGTLYAYTKNASGGWTEEMSGVAANLGRGGVGKQKEGDQKTPLGTFRMNTPFGIKAAESGFPANYLKVTDTYYWSAEKDSTYNTLRNSAQDGKTYTSASEHLSAYGGYYDYAINIGYNPDCEIGKGSALFLHCKVQNQNTGGCVAIPAEDMKKVLRLYKEGKTVMIIRNKGDF